VFKRQRDDNFLLFKGLGFYFSSFKNKSMILILKLLVHRQKNTKNPPPAILNVMKTLNMQLPFSFFLELGEIFPQGAIFRGF